MWKQRAGIKSKKITQHEQLRVIFGLMPAFFFIFFCVGMIFFDSIFCQNAVWLEKQNAKKMAREKRFLT